MAGSKQGETKAATDRAPRLIAAAGAAAEPPGGFRPAPVELWHPATCGAVDIVVDREGNWRHEGAPIARPAMVRLFASVLRREPDGSYVLVTPHEKLAITVEDAPFLAVELVVDEAADPPGLAFVTNVGETVPLDAEHPLRLGDGDADAPFVPYVLVRGGLEAKLTRAVAQELAGRAEIRRQAFGVVSGGQFFVIGSAAAGSPA